MGAHRELLPALRREPVSGRTRGGRERRRGDDEAVGSGRGGKRTPCLGVGGRTRASERASRAGTRPVWN